MALTVLNLGRIRDLVSNLGWKENSHYVLGANCLDSLKSIEEELLNDDVVNRNVHIGFFICGTVKKDLIPILLHGKDLKVLSAVVRVLVNLSLPISALLPTEDAVLSSKAQNVQKQLISALLGIKKCFLSNSATFPIVSMLREAMIKSEKHAVPLSESDCCHLKNCLLLLRNILHLPEESASLNDKHAQDYQNIQNKLIWNLFVQGLDGAMLLMLNSKYRVHWTQPLTIIIALLYRNQNISKIHEVLETVSSGSETSADEEESDGSKNSSVSLSSEASKVHPDLSDSGCPIPSDTSCNSGVNKLTEKSQKSETPEFDIHTKLQKVQISDESDDSPLSTLHNLYQQNPFPTSFIFADNDSESSSSESPHHKKIKGSISDDDISMSEGTDDNSKGDSGVNERMDFSSALSPRKSSTDSFDKKSIQNFIAVQRLRNLQMHEKISESDSSYEDVQKFKKYRSHPPTGRRGKSPRRINGCTPSVCIDSAIVTSVAKGRMKYPLWEKRNSVTTLVDASSEAPSDEDIGNIIKEFTLSFLHGGLSNLVKDIMNLILTGPPGIIDKSILFWIINYFLHLAAMVHISLDHISCILSTDIIGYLVYESVVYCENIELHSEASEEIKKYLSEQLTLVVSTLKEIFLTIDIYSRKCSSQRDKAFFLNLCGKLADLQHLHHLPLLLFHSSSNMSIQGFVENVVILNHYIITVIEKGMEQFPDSKKINLFHHLKHFSTKSIIKSYGALLESYKYNSSVLNECVFTMMHHIAGDIHASDLLIEPTILKTFSSILKEDVDLEPYQEDLIMYILNKFSHQIQKSHQKKRKSEEGQFSGSSDHSSSSSSSVNSNCILSEEDDDLFWWYLQFEQDKDPIARISEHIPTSKRDILSKLLLKGIISPEKHQSLEEKMKDVEEKNNELISCDDLVQMDNFDDEITHLLRTIVQSGWRQHLTWIQETLLEACFVKLGLNTHIPEPVPFYSFKIMTSIPLVPYTEEQRLILKDDMFRQLLKKIGFHVGINMSPMFPRIPLSWTTDVLFTIAARLGPMRKDKLKFSYEDLLLADASSDPSAAKLTTCPTLPALSSCGTLSSWLSAVQKSKGDLMG